jgi:hypothetical protein
MARIGCLSRSSHKKLRRLGDAEERKLLRSYAWSDILYALPMIAPLRMFHNVCRNVPDIFHVRRLRTETTFVALFFEDIPWYSTNALCCCTQCVIPSIVSCCSRVACRVAHLFIRLFDNTLEVEATTQEGDTVQGKGLSVATSVVLLTMVFTLLNLFKTFYSLVKVTTLSATQAK